MNNYKVVGLHRSGTNYLNELIKINFIFDHYSYSDHSTASEVDSNNQCLILVIKKELPQWLESVQKENTGAWGFRSEYSPPYKNVWYNYYREWEEKQCQNIEIIAYKDLLLDYTQVLQHLKNKYSLIKKESRYTNTYHVPYSTPFTLEKRLI